jgi:hypothetical protein
MSFPEELQRKCIAHLRPPAPTPISLPSIQDTTVSEPVTNAEEGVAGDEDEYGDRRDEGVSRAGAGGGAGTGATGTAGNAHTGRSPDEKWEEVLELRLRPFLENGVHVVEYGGRDLEE